MIEYRQTDESCFPLYERVRMRVRVTRELKVSKPEGGLGGMVLTETPVEPYIKDFCADKEASVSHWSKRFDIANWAFFMAFDGERPVGAATIVSRTPGVNMLSGRDDLAVLWDIRVDDDYHRMGIGQALFDMAADWSRAQGMRQMKIECQTNNVPAVTFYHKQGAVLSAINEYAYYNEPAYRHETQMLWYLDL